MIQVSVRSAPRGRKTAHELCRSYHNAQAKQRQVVSPGSNRTGAPSARAHSQPGVRMTSASLAEADSSFPPPTFSILLSPFTACDTSEHVVAASMSVQGSAHAGHAPRGSSSAPGCWACLRPAPVVQAHPGSGYGASRTEGKGSSKGGIAGVLSAVWRPLPFASAMSSLRLTVAHIPPKFTGRFVPTRIAFAVAG